ALPLIVVSDGMQREARFPDFGIADYGGPILGPVVIASPRHLRTVWRAVRRALKDCTLIRLENMPRTIAGRPNPLATRGTVVPSRHARHLLVIDTTVEDMLRGRGKKYRKEVERCHRLWEKEGATLFARAETATEAARAFATLDEQQAARHAALGSHYVIDQPEYRSFYERLAVDGTACDLCYLFTLGTETETIATLLGIVHEDTFTLLRISNGGERWSHLSPGRLIVVEAMRYFVERGLRRFDMGIGDYAFKRGFGIVGEGLVDLVEARRITGLSAAALHRLKARARQSALIGRLRGRKPAAPHA
ncbi:MAG: GNAT family N-acetyltransferase, partial [Hyphomicrobium sp.]